MFSIDEKGFITAKNFNDGQGQGQNSGGNGKRKNGKKGESEVIVLD